MQHLIDKLKSKDKFFKIDHSEIENKVLHLTNRHLDNDDIEMISIAMQNNLDIQELNLSGISLDYEGVEILAEGVAANNNIIALNLSDCRINDEKLELICEALILNTSLKRLNISSNDIRHNVDLLSKMIKNNEHVRSLDISRNDIDTKSMQIIADAIAVSNSIEEVNLSYMGSMCHHNIDIEVIKTLSSNKHLSSINLSANNISYQKLLSILECLDDGKNITSLNLSKNNSLFNYHEMISNISIEHREAIYCMLANTNIKVLDLSHIIFNNDILNILKKGIGKNTSIEHLDLSNSSLGNNDNYQIVESLCDIIKDNKVLRSLNLAKNYFSDKSLRLLINALETNKTLQVLDLSGHELGDRATKKLNNILQRNIDHAVSADQEDDVLYSVPEIALNETNKCAIIGDMIDGTDNV